MRESLKGDEEREEGMIDVKTQRDHEIWVAGRSAGRAQGWIDGLLFGCVFGGAVAAIVAWLLL